MPENSGWVIRPTAEIDLSTIGHYGANNLGIEQADLYADSLFAFFDLLADIPETSRERGEFIPSVAIHPSEMHLVIYRTDGQGIEIIRLLHAHQNLMASLHEF